MKRDAHEAVPANAATQERAGFATRVIHAGQAPDPSTGAIMPPIYATSTFVQSSPGVHQGLDYGRSHNPTRWALERCVADLESGAQAFAFASGMAAIATTLEAIDAGSHVVAGDDLYGGTFRLFNRVRARSAGTRFDSSTSPTLPTWMRRCVPTPSSCGSRRRAIRCSSSPTSPPSRSAPMPSARSRSPTTPSRVRTCSARSNSASTRSCTRRRNT